jgi:hypothetical protein
VHSHLLTGSPSPPPPTHAFASMCLPTQVYQDLCKKHTTFRERSENVDLAVSSNLETLGCCSSTPAEQHRSTPAAQPAFNCWSGLLLLWPTALEAAFEADCR